MQLIQRASALTCAGTAAAALLLAAAPASAGGTGGPVVSTDDVAGVVTDVQNPGSPGVGGTRPAGGSSGGSGGSGGTSGPTCTYTQVIGGAEEYAYQEPGRVVGEDGYYVQARCSDGTSRVYWQPTGTGGPGPVLPSPGELAERARNRLQLPNPQVGFSPDPATHPYQLVNVPTWWWTENWTTRTQRTAAGPVFAEVTATPVVSTFDGGDGSAAATCDRPGVVWRKGLSEDTPGTCRFTYKRSATGLTATISTTWRVTWVGSGGTGGTLDPITTSTTQALTVYERQAVVTYGRG